MFLKRSWKGVLLNGLVIALLLSLPIAAGAQTTGTTETGAATSAAQTNGITSPKDMAAVSGTVEVRGYANVPNFVKWQLDLLPNSDASAATFLALGEKAGEFTYSLDTSKLPAGEHSLRLRVVRADSNYDEYFSKFTVGGAAGAGGAATSGAKPAATPTPAATPAGGAGNQGTAAPAGQGVTANGLAAPREGQAIGGQFVIRGFAGDPNFAKWQLDLLPGGNANQAAFLALGETTGVFTHTLDTTGLPAGQHALRLRVVRNDSNYSEYFTNFTIGGATAGSGATGGGTAGSATATAAATPTPAATGTTGGNASGTTTPSANGISAPKEGATVRGAVEVMGFANAPDFLKSAARLAAGRRCDPGGFPRIR